jgi:hypothetical protein
MEQVNNFINDLKSFSGIKNIIESDLYIKFYFKSYKSEEIIKEKYKDLYIGNLCHITKYNGYRCDGSKDIKIIIFKIPQNDIYNIYKNANELNFININMFFEITKKILLDYKITKKMIKENEIEINFIKSLFNV